MPRFIEKHKKRQTLKVEEGLRRNFETWLYNEIEDALSSRKRLDAIWRECLKMYNGVPKIDTRDVPIPNAPNIEVTIGAIAADTINAQAIDLIFNTSPLVTVRPKPKFKDDMETVAEAKALQRFVNHISTSPETNLREAVETFVLDDIQLGTGVLYVPYVQKRKKTKTAKILNAAPRFYCMPVEDVIVPSGSSQCVDDLPFLGLRFHYTMQELVDYAKVNNWNLEHASPAFEKDWVRSSREMLGRQTEGVLNKGNMFDVMHIFCYYDIDGDGYDEDLHVVWNHSGRALLHINYNAMDRRPIEKAVYQRIPHLFFGLGVLQMMMPFEEKLTDVHNYATLNILLANSRVWVGSEGLPETMKIWPGKYVQTPNPSEDLIPLQMADVYNSIWQDQMVTMQLANQRVGINDVSQPSNIPSRTPGVTAMSFLQQVNRRFTPAFDSMRDAIGGAIRQACYRYSERLLSGDQKVTESIMGILGYEDGSRVINVLLRDTFDEAIDLELTAASASVNREADRQNAIMLTNILSQYYQRTLELVALAANPQTPPEVASVARKIADSASEVIDRTVRTFDQIRDPATFVVEIEEEINSIEQTAEQQQALGALMQMLGGGAAQPQLEAPERTMA